VLALSLPLAAVVAGAGVLGLGMIGYVLAPGRRFRP
jgi:hypothetical protein